MISSQHEIHVWSKLPQTAFFLLPVFDSNSVASRYNTEKKRKYALSIQFVLNRPLINWAFFSLKKVEKATARH